MRGKRKGTVLDNKDNLMSYKFKLQLSFGHSYPPTTLKDVKKLSKMLETLCKLDEKDIKGYRRSDCQESANQAFKQILTTHFNISKFKL